LFQARELQQRTCENEELQQRTREDEELQQYVTVRVNDLNYDFDPLVHFVRLEQVPDPLRPFQKWRDVLHFSTSPGQGYTPMETGESSISNDVDNPSIEASPELQARWDALPQADEREITQWLRSVERNRTDQGIPNQFMMKMLVYGVEVTKQMGRYPH
jgi:hypothetical protein